MEDAKSGVIRTTGAILWYEPDSRQGAVETEDRRHLRFVRTKFPFEPRIGELVSVVLDPSAEVVEEQVRVRSLGGGRRELVQLEDVEVPALGSEAIRGPLRPAGVEAPRLIRMDVDPNAAPSDGGGGGGGGRRRATRRAYPARRSGEAFAVGQSVLHDKYGQGFVELSTTRIARVKFAGQERQVRVSELVALDD